MHTITFEILAQPSRSKGWARYQAPAVGVKSGTGNPWVSSNHDGAAATGTPFTVDLQVCLNVGKGRTAREEKAKETFALVAEEGATCDLVNVPGSQGLRVRVVGARLA